MAKRVKVNDEYWPFTIAFTDYNGKKFLNTLYACLQFIDEFVHEPYSEEKYLRLQNRIKAFSDINFISIRKGINQMVKMGFINPFLVSYNPNSIEFINAKTNKKRTSLLSKIVYSNSSFNRAVNQESDLNQLNFLIKTLVENGRLTKGEIIALMLVDISTIEKGFLTNDELSYYYSYAQEIGFIERKYNQIAYLPNLLSKLDDLVFKDDILYFKEDAMKIFGSLVEERIIRDPYLHRIYKNQLKDESAFVLGGSKCMLEKLEYPVLIASHIKPFIVSNEDERYDANNGILLSRNMDALFDLGYISFTDDGAMIYSERLPKEVVEAIDGIKLDNVFLNMKRLQYLSFHRERVFN
ncbi:MAG: HNH endonuclease [Flavobacterium sp.]|nr:MAG: HNH endonuclease [Flavobacterium sp.]